MLRKKYLNGYHEIYRIYEFYKWFYNIWYKCYNLYNIQQIKKLSALVKKEQNIEYKNRFNGNYMI